VAKCKRALSIFAKVFSNQDKPAKEHKKDEGREDVVDGIFSLLGHVQRPITADEFTMVISKTSCCELAREQRYR
jgi:hypothetical protein